MTKWSPQTTFTEINCEKDDFYQKCHLLIPQLPKEPPVCGPGDRPADLILDEAQDVEEGEDGQVDVERCPPVLEDRHGDVLNLPG